MIRDLLRYLSGIQELTLISRHHEDHLNHKHSKDFSDVDIPELVLGTSEMQKITMKSMTSISIILRSHLKSPNMKGLICNTVLKFPSSERKRVRDRSGETSHMLYPTYR